MILTLLLLAGLLVSRVERLTERVWIIHLVGSCDLDYHIPIQAAALACPGVDYITVALASGTALAGDAGAGAGVVC